MFNQPLPPLARVPARYGAIGGLIAFIQLMTFFYLDRHPFLIPPHFDFRIVLFVVLLFFCLKELRSFYFQGLLFFWQGMIASLVFTAVFATISSTLLGLFCLFEPRFVAEYIQLASSQIRALPAEVIEQIGKEIYESNLATLPDTNGFDLVSLYFVQCFGISFFISIIISVVLRRQPKYT